MSTTYVRFVTTRIDEDSGKRQGIFQAIAALVDDKALSDHELEEVRSLRAWFNAHLGVPDRFARSRRKNAASKAISWFKSAATDHVSQMHSFCRLLNEHGVSTAMITSTRPGYVVFEDDHQIAAIPFVETTT